MSGPTGGQHAVVRQTVEALQQARDHAAELFDNTRHQTTNPIARIAEELRHINVANTSRTADVIDGLALSADRSLTAAATDAAAAYDIEIHALQSLLTDTAGPQAAQLAPSTPSTIDLADAPERTPHHDKPTTVEVQPALTGAAGGDWATYDETPDTAIKQTTPASCVAAVGEMLTNSRITQDTLIREIGEWSHAESLAAHLVAQDDSRWVGGQLGPENIELIVSKGRPWAAEMFPNESMNRYHHMVLVESVTDEWVAVKDPWEGSSYRMKRDDFDFRWNGNGVILDG